MKMLTIVSNMIIFQKKLSLSTMFIGYDLEAYSTNKARSYCVSLYRLSKLPSKCNNYLTPEKDQELNYSTWWSNMLY